MKILAADIGFGYTKATDGKQSQIFKSIVGDANEAQFGDSLLPGQPQFPRHIGLGGQSFFVGELAEQQSRSRGFTLDQNQFLTQYAKTLALAALVPMVDSGDPVRLVTGLPISFFRKYKDALTTLLQNRHSVTLFKPGSLERDEKIIHIERVRVVPQPFGTMFNLLLNEVGKPTSQRFIHEKIGIIDIGFRTADYTVSDKTRYSERGSQSSDNGISTAYAAIAQVLQEKSGVNVELYRLYDGVSKGTIKIKGKRYDLTGIVQSAFQQLASRIAQEVNRLWADDWDIDAIIISGGGGALLEPYLSPLIEGEVLPQPADQDARLNNVHGYWKYGQHLWGA
ncbi:ParM/StbA family protein [Sinimarinibacterium sp. NLF-5-8]|uniref:ParM/StbA family protein n=1 Tax=Sinimarinibacterium sp. NLF-5-8 TaxID=2698684 RepID=UPI00137C0488|nr:ParM/StbA family protein [Sinimarinibacterium sp. NLF-5-8]QHS08816.1 ParM/StbA family protein [Sinimarinibacterium sp. NLF-5-8]